MVTQATKTKRVRVTRKEIERAKRELLAQAKEPASISPKVVKEKPRYKKDFWYGLVYCDSYGYAWIADFETSGEVRPISLGRTNKFIPYLRQRGIDGEDVFEVLRAFREVRLVRRSQTYQVSKFHCMDGYVPLPGDEALSKANKKSPREKKTQSYHLATKTGTGHISIPPAKSHRITFKKDPQFLASLDELISKGHGIPTTQKELKAKGYDVAYATLGRWVKERRDSI